MYVALQKQIENPRPDAARWVNTVMGRQESGRVPLVEFLVDEVVQKPVVTELLGRQWVSAISDLESRKAALDNVIQFWYRMGYDFVRMEAGTGLKFQNIWTSDETMAGGARSWTDEHRGVITSWQDFERYPWPDVEKVDLFDLEYVSQNLPEGMGLIVAHAGGLFENLSWLMSYEGLSMALFDQPDLLDAIVDRLGGMLEQYYRRVLGLDHLVALFPGDDLGFKTGTLISPAALRQYIFPWMKKYAQMAHAAGMPFFLHSCGNILTVMDDLIDDVGIDGKHSYEDAIIPAEDFQAIYAGRLAVLGGMDVDLLSSGSEEQVRSLTRRLIEVCGARGRFAIGSGNSIPSYVPVKNYLAMVDEALR